MKKHPLQNRTNVQIKGGGGGKGLLKNFQKNSTFLKGGHPLFNELYYFCFPLYKCSPVWTLPSAASFVFLRVFLRGWNETKQGLGNLMSHIKTAQEYFCRSIFASLTDSMANCKLISFYFFVLESTGLYRNRNHVRWRVQRSVTVILF